MLINDKTDRGGNIMKNGWMAVLLSFLLVGDVFAYKNMETFNHVTVGKSLTVTGPSTFTGATTFTGAVTPSGGFGTSWFNGIGYFKTGIVDTGYLKVMGVSQHYGIAYFNASNGLIDSGTAKIMGASQHYGIAYFNATNGLVDSGWATLKKSLTVTDSIFSNYGDIDSAVLGLARITGTFKGFGAGYFGSTVAIAGTQTDSSNLIVLDSARIGKTLQVLGNDWHKLNLYVGTSIYDSSWFYGLKSGTFTDTVFAKMGKFDSSIIGVLRTTGAFSAGTTSWFNGIGYFGDALNCSTSVAIGTTLSAQGNTWLHAQLDVQGAFVDSTTGKFMGDLTLNAFVVGSGFTRGTTTFTTGVTRKAIQVVGLTSSTYSVASWVADPDSAALSLSATAGIATKCKTDSLIILIAETDTFQARVRGLNYMIMK